VNKKWKKFLYFSNWGRIRMWFGISFDVNPDPNVCQHQNGKYDPDPDRHQNDADAQHWYKPS
jgi:hypothetical protein